MERKHLEKHLDIIQQNISRMASNSFTIKGWLIALISAGYIFVSKEYSKYLILLSIILIVGFAFLDSMYLQNERKFRCLYNIVVLDTNQKVIKDLEINIKHEKIINNKDTHLFRCLFSRSIIIPYLFMLIYNIMLFIMVSI